MCWLYKINWEFGGVGQDNGRREGNLPSETISLTSEPDLAQSDRICPEGETCRPDVASQ